ncbi:MAG: hypothetical protein ACI4EP_05955 [Suilimivivens sp.]
MVRSEEPVEAADGNRHWWKFSAEVGGHGCEELPYMPRSLE